MSTQLGVSWGLDANGAGFFGGQCISVIRHFYIKNCHFLKLTLLFWCDRILRQFYILMTTKLYPITLYRSKTALAKSLGISRRTIQRKVSKGEISQDTKGRVCVDELIALLKSDRMKIKRGPKINLGLNNYNKAIYSFKLNSLEKEILEVDNLTKLNETIDHDIAEGIKQKLFSLSSATLQEIAKQAMCISNHKRRLAKLGLSFDSSMIMNTLKGM